MEARVESILNDIRLGCERILGENLVGIYVHGSLALGCFTWDESDIDYLVIVNRPMDDAKKAALIRDTLRIDAYAPEKGLEMSVMTLEACRHFSHPAPYELHFSHGHLDRARSDPEAFAASMHGLDPDLAAHCTITRHAGFVLCGPDIASVFAPVPRQDYLSSIWFDVEGAQEDIMDHPVYVILNLCRVLAAAKDGFILSKKDGGLWGMKHLPESDVPIVEAALNAYVRAESFSVPFNDTDLPAFADRMKREIQKYL